MTDTDEEALVALLRSKPHLYQSSVMLAREARGFELGKAKGRAAGTAEALAQMIVARGQKLTDEQRARIFTCDDTAQLMDWIRRASKLPSMADVLGIRDPWI